MKGRARTLLIPYLLWSALGLMMTWGLEEWSFSVESVRAAQLSQRIAEYSWQDALLRWVLSPLPFQLWFIRVLFVYNAAYPLLLRAVERVPKIWFGFIVCVWLLLPIHLGFAEPEGLLFFTLKLFNIFGNYGFCG
jgi:hypothetical protein